MRAPDAPAIRIVVRARAGLARRARALPPLILHDTAGDGFSARADAINNGRARFSAIDGSASRHCAGAANAYMHPDHAAGDAHL